jgi:hypothetical protein
MKYKTCLCVITAITISSILYADNSYKGRGEAVIVNNNLPDAKKAALSDAFKNACSALWVFMSRARQRLRTLN